MMAEQRLYRHECGYTVAMLLPFWGLKKRISAAISTVTADQDARGAKSQNETHDILPANNANCSVRSAGQRLALHLSKGRIAFEGVNLATPPPGGEWISAPPGRTSQLKALAGSIRPY
jgi:hypothetical protein